MIKKIVNLLFLPALLMLLMVSCEKDGTMVVATSGTQPGLTASAITLNYTEADTAKTAVTFTRTTSDFGYDAAVDYTLEFSAKGTNFEKVTSYTMSETSIDFTVKDFNALVLGLKYSAGVKDTVYARVLAEAADSLFIYSDVVKITVTPYAAKRVIPYPFLYVPGAYQGWSPGGDVIAKLYSPDKNGQYEGCVNLPDADNPFKLTPAPNWDNSYGMLTATTMTYDGGGNFDIAGAGYYLIKANTNTGTWSATLQNWGIIGDVNGWAGDIQFEFEDSAQVLVKTVELPVGGLKFRANGATQGWAINYGTEDDGTGKGIAPNPVTGMVPLVSGGKNITITEAGMYKITLDLRVPSEPYCTIVKQ